MPSNTTRVPVTFEGLPDLKKFTGWQEALLTLLKGLRVEVPDTITNVKISNEPPDTGQTNYIWGKRDNAGNFLGFAVFSQGEWRVIASPTPPGAIFRMDGDSDNPPDGYAVVNATLIGSTNLIKLQTQWNPPGDGTTESDGPWTLFDVQYVGF